MLKKFRDYFRRLKVLEERSKMQEAEIRELKAFMKTAKEFQQRKNLKIDKANKWLHSYPDQSTNRRKA